MTKKRFFKLYRAEVTKKYLEAIEWERKVYKSNRYNKKNATEQVKNWRHLLSVRKFKIKVSYAETWKILCECLFDGNGYKAPRK